MIVKNTALVRCEQERCSLLVRRELEQDIRLNLQHSCDVEQYIKRNSMHHIRGFDCAHVLSADTDSLSNLFLCKPFPFSIISNCTA